MSRGRVNNWWQNDPNTSEVISFSSVSIIPYCWIIIPNYELLLVLALFPLKCRYFLTFCFLRKGRAVLFKEEGQPVFVNNLGPFSPQQKVCGYHVPHSSLMWWWWSFCFCWLSLPTEGPKTGIWILDTIISSVKHP